MSTHNVATGEDISTFTYEQFLELHKNQLQSSCVPELYWQTLFIKLKNEVMSFRDLCFHISNPENCLCSCRASSISVQVLWEISKLYFHKKEFLIILHENNQSDVPLGRGWGGGWFN